MLFVVWIMISINIPQSMHFEKVFERKTFNSSFKLNTSLQNKWNILLWKCEFNTQFVIVTISMYTQCEILIQDYHSCV